MTLEFPSILLFKRKHQTDPRQCLLSVIDTLVCYEGQLSNSLYVILYVTPQTTWKQQFSNNNRLPHITNLFLQNPAGLYLILCHRQSNYEMQ